MNRSKKFKESLLKNLPQKLGITFIALFVICGILFVSGNWGGLTKDDPDDDSPNIGGTPSPGQPSEQTPEPTPGQTPEPTPEPTPDPTPEPPYTGPRNPLSGLPIDEELVNNRPFAVVLSNEVNAMPMSGVSRADILYEYPAYSGGDTRMLGIFQDFTDIRRVGAIRSVRHNVVQIAGSYDAILLHGGWSTLGKAELQGGSVTYFNGVEGPGTELFFRDRDRVPGRRVDNLHALVTSSERIASRLPRSTRTVHNDNFDQGLIFSDDVTLTGGGVAKDISVRYSARKSSSFTYNEAGNFYHFRQFNRDFIDANNNSKPEFANVLIIKTSVTVISGNPDRLMEIVTTGTGDGYFIHGGRYVEIKWSRANMSSQYVYTHLDGTPLELGRGATFISVVPTRQIVTEGANAGPNVTFS